MAKRVKEVALGTRTARMRLPARHKPFFRALGEGLHIGYRRSTVAGRAGTWLLRRYLGAGNYETHILGVADDLPEGNTGDAVLTFDQAQAASRALAKRRMASSRAAAEAAPTVRRVVVDYIAQRKRRNATAGRDAELRLTRHVLSAPLAAAALPDLTEACFTAWRDGLRRGGRSAKPSGLPLAPATLARLLNDLRAAITPAARKAKLPADALASIREGLRAPEAPDRAREQQVLADADVRRIVQAAADHDADFGRLILVLAATGARLDQAARITVADFQHEAGRIMVPVSRKGRGAKQVSHVAVPLPADVAARLRAIVAGRMGHEPLLMRWHHRQVEGEKVAGLLPRWERESRRPWTSSAEMTRPWRTALAAAGLPVGLVPYCLRHSSIVRGLRAGLPVRLVAAVHDTSAAMVERHYAAFIVDATEELLRRAAVPLASPVVERLLRA